MTQLDEAAHEVEQLKKQHSLMRDVNTEKLLYADVTSPAQFDSVFIAKYKDSNLTLFTIEGRKYPVSLLIDRIKGFGKMRDEQAKKFLDGKINYKKLDLTRMAELHVEGLEGTAYTLIAYSKALKKKVLSRHCND